MLGDEVEMATTNRKMVDNPVVHRIVKLVKKKGKRERDLTDYLGLPPGAMSRWKYDGSYVYVKYIYEICEFLDTTPNYLFFGPDDEEDCLTLRERNMISLYRKLDEGRKNCVEEMLAYIANGNKTRKKSSMNENSEKLLL